LLKNYQAIYSHVVEYNDARYRLHANLLRKFHTQIDLIRVNSLVRMPVCVAHYPGDEIAHIVDVTAINCAVIFDHDALFGLQKYKYWLYGRKTILYSDHNPLLFLTESTPKSSKLMP